MFCFFNSSRDVLIQFSIECNEICLIIKLDDKLKFKEILIE